jgi:thiopeptide-type bacteriocin biosynthesis protein
VLSRAAWQLRADQFNLDKPDRFGEQLAELGLPPQFLIASGDNELRIDLGTGASVQLLGQELRRTGTLRVVECLTIPSQCPSQDAAGHRYVHELVLPFLNTAAPAYAGVSAASAPGLPRRFSVGSEWLYLKIYAGEKASDSILTDSLYPAIQELISQQTIQAFFFIRYKDQDPHLRLRFRGNPHLEFYNYVIRRIERALQPYVQEGLVHKIQTDTYQRELERYGTDTMELCEQIFYQDSLSTLQFMSQTGEAFDENLRFAFAAHKVDRLLGGLGLTTAGCHELLDHLKEQFFAEFKGDAGLRQQLNDRYRTYKPLIEQALTRPFALANGLENWVDRQRPFLAELGRADLGDARSRTLVGSLIHMTINRLFPSKQRAYELVLYHCLAKYYDSQRARHRQGV